MCQIKIRLTNSKGINNKNNKYVTKNIVSFWLKANKIVTMIITMIVALWLIIYRMHIRRIFLSKVEILCKKCVFIVILNALWGNRTHAKLRCLFENLVIRTSIPVKIRYVIITF